MIICCMCYYDWCLLKINKDEKKFENLFSDDPFVIPRIDSCFSNCVAEIRYRAPIGWFSSCRSVLLHVCSGCLNDATKITAEANNIDFKKSCAMTCRFVSQAWHVSELNQGNCDGCGLKNCLKIISKFSFNILDSSNILQKKMKAKYFIVSAMLFLVLVLDVILLKLTKVKPKSVKKLMIFLRI